MKVRQLLNTKIPKYIVLEHVLRQSVEQLTPGERLPSDNDLARQYGVSRVTLQRALGALVDDGVVSRQQGRGTFVLGAHVPRAVHTLTGALDSLMVYESNAKGRVLDKAMGVQPPPDVRRHLKLGPTDTIVIFERLLLTHGEPFVYLANYLPMELGKLVFQDDAELVRFPIISLLRDKYKVHFSRASQTIEAVLSDPIISQHLTIPVGSPLLLAERTFYTIDGKAAQFTQSWYRSDRYKYSVTLHNWDRSRWEPPGEADAGGRAAGRRKGQS